MSFSLVLRIKYFSLQKWIESSKIISIARKLRMVRTWTSISIRVWPLLKFNAVASYRFLKLSLQPLVTAVVRNVSYYPKSLFVRNKKLCLDSECEQDTPAVNYTCQKQRLAIVNNNLLLTCDHFLCTSCENLSWEIEMKKMAVQIKIELQPFSASDK